MPCSEAHTAFKELYEAKVESELQAHGESRDGLVLFLQDGQEENDGVAYLLDMLLGIADFEHFADLMIRRRDGKRITLPVNVADALDITDLIFGYEDYADGDDEGGPQDGDRDQGGEQTT